MTLLATRRKAASCSPVGAAASRAPGSSGSSDMTRSEKHLDRDHASSWLHMTAPASRSSDATDGSSCTTRDLRFISLLVRSCRLLVRKRFQWPGGMSRYASASGSASSSIRVASGQQRQVGRGGRRFAAVAAPGPAPAPAAGPQALLAHQAADHLLRGARPAAPEFGPRRAVPPAAAHPGEQLAHPGPEPGVPVAPQARPVVLIGALRDPQESGDAAEGQACRPPQSLA